MKVIFNLAETSLSAAAELDRHARGVHTDFAATKELASGLSAMIEGLDREDMIILGSALEKVSDQPPISHGDVKNGITGMIAAFKVMPFHLSSQADAGFFMDFCIALHDLSSARDWERTRRRREF